MDQPHRLSLTATISRQTPRTDFGSVLQSTLQQATQLTGSLLGAIPGAGILSAAVGKVSALASSSGTGSASASGVLPMTSGASVGSSTGAPVPADLNGYLDQMRQEADRSMMMQMQLQQESREYNTLSNVLKVRHDSAKAAINNLR